MTIDTLGDIRTHWSNQGDCHDISVIKGGWSSPRHHPCTGCEHQMQGVNQEVFFILKNKLPIGTVCTQHDEAPGTGYHRQDHDMIKIFPVIIEPRFLPFSCPKNTEK